jgi:hypothetical protein
LAQATVLTLPEHDIESALAAIPSGDGVYEGLRYAVTVRKSRDGKPTNLFARALAGGNVVSFNLYRLRVPAKCRLRRSSRLFSGSASFAPRHIAIFGGADYS